MRQKSSLLLSFSMALILMMSCTNTPKNKGEMEAPSSDAERMVWWREAKFGLFIHWGVYAVPAGKYGDNTNYGEWIMHSAKIPSAVYKEFASQFNPVKYNPEERDCLWRISLELYGNANLWPLIYIENRGKIIDPDLIFPGQKLVIPPDPMKKTASKKIKKKAK